jgi:4-amino-4-deoxy-L-arabinose transferase-like glycosyltransferase
LLLAAYLRLGVFTIQHIDVDQTNYVTLAMKLEKCGFNEYNLRQVNARFVTDQLTWARGIWYPINKDQGKGDLLKVREQIGGIIQYDIPLYYMAPAFPYMLMVSHLLFSDSKDYRVSILNPNGKDKFNREREFISNQFYLCIVPFFFSLMLIVSTFFLGIVSGNAAGGFIAAGIIAFSGVDIFTAHRLWPADMCGFFVTISFIFMFMNTINKKRNLFYFLSGLFFSVAVLTRQNVLVLLPVLLFSVFLDNLPCSDDGGCKVCIVKRSSFSLAWVILPLIVLTGPWFMAVYKTYGTFFYDTAVSMKDMVDANKTQFYDTLGARPHVSVLFTVGLMAITPFFIFSLATLKDFFISVLKLIKGKVENKNMLLLWSGFFFFLLYFSFFRDISKEHRYLIPVYPFLAVLAGVGVIKVYKIISRLGKSKVLRVSIIFMFIVLFIINAYWSSKLGITAGMNNKVFILTPF